MVWCEIHCAGRFWGVYGSFPAESHEEIKRRLTWTRGPLSLYDPPSHTQQSTAGSCCEYMGHNRSVITYALLSPPPASRPVPVPPPVPRVDMYSIGVDPSKRAAPGFA
eukprot:1651098-Prymnesium_polylepis.1